MAAPLLTNALTQYPLNPLTESGYVNNYAATTDPTATNDASQGFGPGSSWVNVTSNRFWVCMIATIGAAIWYAEGDGVLYTNVSTTPGTQPASTGADIVMDTFSLPAGYFSAARKTAYIQVLANVVANANTKTIKIIVNPTTFTVGSAVVGGTTIASLIAVTTGGGASLVGAITKYGATGSNTQIGMQLDGQWGNTGAIMLSPQALTLTESAAVPVAITINNATTASDSTWWMTQVQAIS